MNLVTLPARWENWSITRKIGEGSFGTVYRAECSIGTEKTISAIKIVEVPSDEYELQSLMNEMLNEQTVRAYYKDLVDGYADEIRTMDALKGITNIVSIEDFCLEEKPDGIGWIIYIRMEYLQSFHEYSNEQKLTENDVIRLGVDICTALSYCEKLNIVHRDIKPDNIFLSPMGHFKLGDFGVARRLDRTVGSYSAKGTYTYMAPEVYKGEHYGARADIYSLGMVLYRLLNRNRDPFVDPYKQMIYYKDREEALKQRMDGNDLPDPADAGKDLAKIIRKATAFRQEDRYESASLMKEDLERLQLARREKELMDDGDRTMVIPKPPQPPRGGVQEGEEKRKMLLAAGGVLGAAALLTGSFFLGRSFAPSSEGSAAEGRQAENTASGSADAGEDSAAAGQQAENIASGSADAGEDSAAAGGLRYGAGTDASDTGKSLAVPYVGEVNAVHVEQVYRIRPDHDGPYCFETARTGSGCAVGVSVCDENGEWLFSYESDEQTVAEADLETDGYYDLHVSYLEQDTGFLIDVYPQEDEHINDDLEEFET